MIEITEETYQYFMQISFEEFVWRAQCINAAQIMLWISAAGAFLFALKMRLPKITRKKFKYICQMEDRTYINQEKKIIKEFIDRYEKDHGLIWDDQAGEYR